MDGMLLLLLLLLPSRIVFALYALLPRPCWRRGKQLLP